jgi:hypothetical protein
VQACVDEILKEFNEKDREDQFVSLAVRRSDGRSVTAADDTTRREQKRRMPPFLEEAEKSVQALRVRFEAAEKAFIDAAKYFSSKATPSIQSDDFFNTFGLLGELFSKYSRYGVASKGTGKKVGDTEGDVEDSLKVGGGSGKCGCLTRCGRGVQAIIDNIKRGSGH